MKHNGTLLHHSATERWEFMLDTSDQMAQRAKMLIDRDGVQVEIKTEMTPIRSAGATDGDVKFIQDTTKVTNIDKDLNRFFIDAVKSTWPNDHVWGEEESLGEKGNVRSLGKNWLWMTDPIDGTSGFIRAVKSGNFKECTSSIMLGLFAPGSQLPSYASVNTAFCERPFHVYADGYDTYHCGKDPGNVRKLVVNFLNRSSDIERYEENWWSGAVPQLDKIMCANLPHARKIKTSSLGTTASRLALGDMDIAVFPYPSAPHDVSLSALIAHSAGAVVSDLQGIRFGEGDIDWRVGPLSGLLMAKNNKIAERVLNFEGLRLPDNRVLTGASK